MSPPPTLTTPTMTPLLDSHTHMIRFLIDPAAPSEYMDRWTKIKQKIENGDNEWFVNELHAHCNLSSNRNLPYLDRCEGGIGNNNNLLYKQLRFKQHEPSREGIPFALDNDICIDQIYSTAADKWTYEELDDLIAAMIKVLEYHVQETRCILGRIELQNSNSYQGAYNY